MNPISCPLDIIPSHHFKEVFNTICPVILAIINNCLTDGVVPFSFLTYNYTTVTKESNLDPNDHNNYRHISKLPFISNILEKVVFFQVSCYLNSFNIFDKFQSGFQALHSPDSAPLNVYNDILLSVDIGSCAILVLLDLNTAFDTIDHVILLKRLEGKVGLQGPVLEWLAS